MKHIFGFLLCLNFFCIQDITSQTSEMKASSLHYLVREPKTKIAKPKLLILLHGVGSNEQDLFSLAQYLPDDFLILSVRGLYAYNQGYAWYNLQFTDNGIIHDKIQAESSRKLLIEFIAGLKNKYQYDASQIYLCGFSQGAIMSYYIALSKPDLIKGIAVMSGRMLEETKTLVQKEKVKSLKVFISHGTEDPVLKIQYARDAKTYLQSIGIQPVYKEYKDVHTINQQMLSDLINWLKH